MEEIVDSLMDIVSIDEASVFCTDVAPINLEDIDYESEALTEYITSDINPSKNNDVTKIIAAAMKIAQQSNNTLPATSPLQTAMVAVASCDKLNFAYLLETGAIIAETAADAIVDQTAANASIVAEMVLQPSVIEKGLNYGLDMLSNAYPPAAVPAQAAKMFTPTIASFVNEKIKPIVQNGIKTVAKAAKSIIHGVVDKVKTAIPQLGRKILSIFN